MNSRHRDRMRLEVRDMAPLSNQLSPTVPSATHAGRRPGLQGARGEQENIQEPFYNATIAPTIVAFVAHRLPFSPSPRPLFFLPLRQSEKYEYMKNWFGSVSF
jgi:hypothetical protein